MKKIIGYTEFKSGHQPSYMDDPDYDYVDEGQPDSSTLLTLIANEMTEAGAFLAGVGKAKDPNGLFWSDPNIPEYLDSKINRLGQMVSQFKKSQGGF